MTARNQPVTAQTSLANAGSEPSAADLLRSARTELFGLCEAVQDRAYDQLTTPDLSDAERGFLRGQRHEAKGIARAMSDVFRDLIAKAEQEP
jgi:hypothetical protein